MEQWVVERLEEERALQQTLRPVFMGVPVGYDGFADYESFDERSYLVPLISGAVAGSFAFGCCCSLMCVYIYRQTQKIEITDEHLEKIEEAIKERELKPTIDILDEAKRDAFDRVKSEKDSLKKQKRRESFDPFEKPGK